MNKELIKKYKSEFNHWINRGKLLQKQINLVIPAKLEEFLEDWNRPIDELAVIINDEYAEFRKALAENKEVEYSITDLNRNHIRWVNVLDQANSYNIDTKVFNYELSAYRIKPEEPKFKVGDWVIHNGKYKRVTKAVDGYIDSLDNAVAVIMKEESLELWKPKDKEYFWYKNDLVKFHETQTNHGTLLRSARKCSYYPAEENFEDFCEPFIGQLPTYIKDNNES